MSKGADKIELFDSAFIITSLPSLTPDAYAVSTTFHVLCVLNVLFKPDHPMCPN